MSRSIAAGSQPLPADAVELLVATAVRAPSVHNTQPWRFDYTADGSLELRAADDRALPVADPKARELIISCGAALLNLRLAIRQLQLQPYVELLPDDDDPLLLARIRALPAPPISRDEQILLAAIPRRHTHRQGFTDRALSPTLWEEIADAAAVEGADLRFVDGAALTSGLEALTRFADDAHHADTEIQSELRAWTPPPGSPRRDGVPVESYPPRVPRGGLPGRDFSMGRGWGRIGEAGVGRTSLAVLLTGDDRVTDWLRAGQALQRALLRAAADWVFASFNTQPLEVPHFREAMRALLATRGFPQMVLQLGHATVAPSTPRRPALDVLHRHEDG